MAKISIPIPEVVWRNETFDIPEDKIQVVMEALQSRQEAIIKSVAQRNEEILHKLQSLNLSKQGISTSRRFLMLGSGMATGLLLVSLLPKAVRSVRGSQQTVEQGEQTTSQENAGVRLERVEVPADTA